jgi:hypothetical protein
VGPRDAELEEKYDALQLEEMDRLEGYEEDCDPDACEYEYDREALLNICTP